MKTLKLFGVAAAAVVLGGGIWLLAAEGAPSAAPKLADGAYTGASRGHNGDVTVEVTVKDGRIAAVAVKDFRENRPLTALQDVPARIVEKQKTDVDAVTGATISSKAVMRAAATALAKARPIDLKKVPDGTYTGASRGFMGDVTVEVTVKDGRIAAVKPALFTENRPGTALQDVPARIVEKQSVEVDAVTGATISSQAVMRAAESALAGAPQKQK
jgi:uncharacterized protein with FMN-binding domain